MKIRHTSEINECGSYWTLLIGTFNLTRQKDEDKETDLLTCGVDVLGIIKQKVIDPVLWNKLSMTNHENLERSSMSLMVVPELTKEV